MPGVWTISSGRPRTEAKRISPNIASSESFSLRPRNPPYRAADYSVHCASCAGTPMAAQGPGAQPSGHSERRGGWTIVSSVTDLRHLAPPTGDIVTANYGAVSRSDEAVARRIATRFCARRLHGSDRRFHGTKQRRRSSEPRRRCAERREPALARRSPAREGRLPGDQTGAGKRQPRRRFTARPVSRRGACR